MNIDNKQNNDMKYPIVMEGVSEYAEGMRVRINIENGMEVVEARNEGGFNRTLVDLDELLQWVSCNMPDKYNKYMK